MRRSLWSFARADAGQAIVLIAITFLATTMIVGLAIDAGQLFVARRTAQEAADAGAYAGAVVHYQRLVAGVAVDTALANAAAVTDATRNGYTDGVAGATVTVNTPPTSGPYAGNSRYVEVVITEQVRTSIVPGGALTTIRVRGVAGAEPLNNNFAIMSLDRGNTPSAFSASANADVHLSGGGILVNSTNASAATNAQNDPCRFTVTPAGQSVEIAGGGSGFPGGTCSSGAYAGSPALTTETSQPQAPDPFSGFPKPSTTGMTVYNTLPAGSPKVLSPGIYTVQLTGNTVYVLQPGIYVLKAGIDLAGNADLYSAGQDSPSTCALNCGVFLFNTHSGYPGAKGAGDTCGVFNLQGNAAVKAAAMTTGYATGADPGDTYNNLLFYQDAACTTEVKIGGNGSFTATGTFYAPSAAFRFDGNNATLTGSQLVAKTVELQNGNITIDFNAGTTAQPILPRLAE